MTKLSAPLSSILERDLLSFSRKPPDAQQPSPRQLQNPVESRRDPDSVTRPSAVQEQVHSLVEQIREIHNDCPFHGFDHCVQVVQNAHVMLLKSQPSLEEPLPSFAADKLSNLALTLACFVPRCASSWNRIPNFCLAKVDPEPNEKYKGQALAEQHSFEVSWKLLMNDEFADLRTCLYLNTQELMRFRHLIIMSVLATDIFSPDLVEGHQTRWRNAFGALTAGDQEEAERRKSLPVCCHRF
ncbi:Guanylate cyclase [Seminavis robusta]|uniref:Guanylate cyclase n=1 Tax=Seminavis robusta TaxID=568900 RepID=A0A9N8HDE9_9STRA|nr:Guanylate cyclase [Seminavis robusta]|eukprot:Sro357_g125590.1 Guanylate cyclase (241) ;mRNA; f:26178-27081